MIITLAGASASGKGTVGKILAQRLGYQALSIGQMWREAAIKKGMTFEEFHSYMDAHPEEDYKFELLVKEMGEKQDNFIMDSHVGWFMIPHAVKVYLDCDLDIAAKRRMAQQIANRAEKVFTSLEETKQRLIAKTERETARYKRNYGIDPTDKTQFDIVIDTSDLTPEQVADAILATIKKMGYELPQLSS